VTPEAGRRAPFELLAFTAAPVAGALAVIEVEGRFAAQGNGRFTRRPVLVVEADDDRPRLELAPVRAELRDTYWRGAYAVPAEALSGARFALGLRGTLLELPAPDGAEETDRLSALAREANGLRRALEAAEANAVTARAEADATAAELGAAAEQRATDAEARARVADEAARAADAGTEVLRAELAEERERARAVSVTADPKLIAPASTHTAQPRGPGPWIAVGALVLFAFVLLGLLFGFLA
jgi:hypothetical protein